MSFIQPLLQFEQTRVVYSRVGRPRLAPFPAILRVLPSRTVTVRTVGVLSPRGSSAKTSMNRVATLCSTLSAG